MAISRKEIVFVMTLGLAGILLGMLPAVRELEQTYGLAWLFKWRGVAPIPNAVVLIALDQESAKQLDLPSNPAQWPRQLHAQLIQQLAKAGASVIAFDLMFDSASRVVQQDEALAAAMRSSANVLVVESLLHENLWVSGANGATIGQASIEKVILPIPLLAQAALGSAPFTLPKDERVNAAWFFKNGAGAGPMLPALALQVHVLRAYDQFVSLLQKTDPDFAASLPANRQAVIERRNVENLVLQLRSYFLRHPQLGQQLLRELAGTPETQIDANSKTLLRALLCMYLGPEAQYLNFYGPARTITTVPYYQALLGKGFPAGGLQDKAVFIGYSSASPNEQDRIRDDYHTVFSLDNGLQLSGVEISATAFANLLDQKMVQALPPLLHLIILFGWGCVTAQACRRWNFIRAIGALMLGAAIYLALAAQLFALQNRWLPLVTPLLLQAPLGLLSATLLRSLDAKKERGRMQQAFSHFIPKAMVEKLARDAQALGASNPFFYGACLATDASSYTSLAEKMHPVALTALMNQYYATLFAPVAVHGGLVSDIKGDAMLAIWTEFASDHLMRSQACQAALEIHAAVGNERTRSVQPNMAAPVLATPILATRIGLDFGPLTLGNVGAGQHYEYRAVGDTVNTASRLEGLNKQLGTWVLASEAVIDGLDDFLLRPLGSFLLPGKSRPVKVFEIVSRRDQQNQQQICLCRAFASALASFQSQQWPQAASAFADILSGLPEDGPSKFYLHHCTLNAGKPFSDSWNGVIHITVK